MHCKLELVCYTMSEKKQRVQKQLQELMLWVTQQVEGNDPPRFSDVEDYAHRVLHLTALTKSVIKKALRLHPAYQMNASQSLKHKRWNKVRPIIVHILGCLHGDIGFFPLTRDYETPVTFRSGFLVCKDILSRFTYVSILKKTRNAESMLKAFQDIFEQFRVQNPGLVVNSLAFDRETSVMGKQVQSFLKENNISFHAFQNTSSKSKMAEGEIHILRTVISRLRNNKEQRWWHLLQPAVDSLNRQPIRVHNKYLKQSDGSYYTPASVNKMNVNHFVEQLQKAVPAYFFNQFMVNPDLIHFKFAEGDFVRQKLIASSSAVIGEKRSDTALGDTVFEITKRIGYISKALTPEPLYVVRNVENFKDIEAFDEQEIALTTHSS